MKKRVLFKATAAFVLALTVATAPMMQVPQNLRAQAITADEAGITVSGKLVPAGNLAQGKPYVIGGNITSKTTMTQVFGGVYSEDGTKRVLYCSDTPNATTYNLGSKFDNALTFNTLAAGKYVYRITVHTGNNDVVLIEAPFSIGNGGAAPSTNTSAGVTVSGKIVPTGNLTQGKPYIIGGIVSSGNTIDQIYGGVYSSDGSKSILYCSDAPKTTTYDLRRKFDNELTFNTLPNGSYLYKVVAKTASGEAVVAESQFTVGGGAAATPTSGSNSVSISGKIVPSGNLTQGKPYIIGGIISSGSTIDQVYGGVYSSDGSKSILYCSDTPKTTSYDLRRKFDNTLTFNTLANGSYLYKIVAKTASGETVVAESPFTVGGGAAATPTSGSNSVSVSGKIVPTGNLTQGKPYIIGGIISSGSTIDQVYGGIYSADGSKSIIYCSDTPKTTAYDLRRKFDNTLTFNTLANGSYLYKIVVKTANGETVAVESPFTVGGGAAAQTSGSSGVTISGSIVPTGALVQGKPYIIGGIISSGSAIDQVYGGVYSSDGKKSIIYCSDTPKTTTYDLRKKFDNELTFNTLPKGSYTYKIMVRTANSETIVAESQFTV